jgi:endonuclease III related protein
MKNKLYAIYDALSARFGPQHWWPGRTPFEVMVGAILTQNTNWSNVEKAIAALKRNKLLTPTALFRLPRRKLAALLRPAGYYNVKALRLESFVKFFLSTYAGRTFAMAREDDAVLRRRLLEVNGIGEETADSILLYALNKPVFVIDAYTRRVFSRHRLCPGDISYAGLQAIFIKGLKKDRKLFNEYHALIVRLGKEYCRKTMPRCEQCPLRDIG